MGKKGATVLSEQNTLTFQEKGQWEEAEVRFSNTYRWRLDFKTGTISLEHLRLGVDRPVFLFRLAPTTTRTLTSIDSNLTANDTYFEKMHAEKQSLRLKWRVIGAQKNQEITCLYSI